MFVEYKIHVSSVCNDLCHIYVQMMFLKFASAAYQKSRCVIHFGFLYVILVLFAQAEIENLLGNLLRRIDVDPMAGAFKERVAEMDPMGLFRNPFLDRVLGPGGAMEAVARARERGLVRFTSRTSSPVARGRPLFKVRPRAEAATMGVPPYVTE